MAIRRTNYVGIVTLPNREIIVMQASAGSLDEAYEVFNEICEQSEAHNAILTYIGRGKFGDNEITMLTTKEEIH